MKNQSNPNWKTQSRGKDEDEYQIYVENARSLGWVVKTFEEWLHS